MSDIKQLLRSHVHSAVKSIMPKPVATAKIQTYMERLAETPKTQKEKKG